LNPRRQTIIVELKPVVLQSVESALASASSSAASFNAGRLTDRILVSKLKNFSFFLTDGGTK
jgi:hypothetical protein